MEIIDIINNFNHKVQIKSNKYFYENKPIPRVSEILSMVGEEYLLEWANAIGLYKRIRYRDEKEKACDIGTQSHNLIEEYIRTRIFNKENIKGNKITIQSVNNAVNSFILWYNDVFLNNKINILGIEQELTCQWFGGTYDLLVDINDNPILIDFKTSNYISYKYFLQLAAYRYMLQLKGININGCIILQLDKKNTSYEEYFLDFKNPIHFQFIEDCINAFFSLVYSYYNILYIKESYNNIFKNK